ncbi:MAG: hypothetical protein JKY43_02210 [Phycisphaerales bacterium]|nr:hypothetical protein [Phycisphaerales bacterium]
MKNLSTKAAATILLSAALLTLSACTSSSSPKHAGNINSIRTNPSPAMQTLARRASDRTNTHAYVIDTNMRSLRNDIDSVFFLDRPSRLHHNIKP